MPTFCTNCGTVNQGDRFCTNCGAPADDGAVDTPTASQPVVAPTPAHGQRRLPGTPIGTPTPPPTPRRRLWPIWAAAAAIVLIGGGVGAFLLVSNRSQTPTGVATSFLKDMHSGNYHAAASLVDPQNRPVDPTGQSLERFSGVDQLAASSSYSVSSHVVTGTHAWVYVRGSGPGDVASTGVVVCERVDGTWYVYFGTTSWAKRSTTPDTSSTTTPSTTTSTGAIGTTTATPTTTAAVTEQQAAGEIASMLAQDTLERTGVNAASASVAACSGDIAQDALTFETSANDRRSFLSDLSTMAGRTLLPSGMLTDLQNAWEASIEADDDLEAWAQDEETSCTTATVTDDSNYQAATGPDQQATIDKKAFVALWNPLAEEFDLATYQWTQI